MLSNGRVYSEASSAEEITFEAESIDQVLDLEVSFVTDSGCTRFMVNDRSHFSYLPKLAKPNPI